MSDALELSDSIVIARTSDEVYGMVADITRMGEYSPVCISCWWDDGGSVSLDPDGHRVYVQIAPTQAGPPDAGSHTVTFEGTDVFGRTRSATIM